MPEYKVRYEDYVAGFVCYSKPWGWEEEADEDDVALWNRHFRHEESVYQWQLDELDSGDKSRLESVVGDWEAEIPEGDYDLITIDVKTDVEEYLVPELFEVFEAWEQQVKNVWGRHADLELFVCPKVSWHTRYDYFAAPVPGRWQYIPKEKNGGRVGRSVYSQLYDWFERTLYRQARHSLLDQAEMNWYLEVPDPLTLFSPIELRLDYAAVDIWPGIFTPTDLTLRQAAAKLDSGFVKLVDTPSGRIPCIYTQDLIEKDSYDPLDIALRHVASGATEWIDWL